MRRTSYHHGDLRAALLSAGRQALAIGQLGSLSLRALSRTVGVTPTAVYRHFRDKDELLEAIAASGYLELRTALRAAVSKSDGRHSALETLVEAYRNFVHSDPEVVRLIFQLRARGGAVGAELDQAASECLAEFVAAVAESVPGREPEAAIRSAVLVWSAVHGFATLAEANAFVSLDSWMLPRTRDLAALGAVAGR